MWLAGLPATSISHSRAAVSGGSVAVSETLGTRVFCSRAGVVQGLPTQQKSRAATTMSHCAQLRLESAVANDCYCSRWLVGLAGRNPAGPTS